MVVCHSFVRHIPLLCTPFQKYFYLNITYWQHCLHMTLMFFHNNKLENYFDQKNYLKNDRNSEVPYKSSESNTIKTLYAIAETKQVSVKFNYLLLYSIQI
jgi:hypothetical protein